MEMADLRRQLHEGKQEMEALQQQNQDLTSQLHAHLSDEQLIARRSAHKAQVAVKSAVDKAQVEVAIKHKEKNQCNDQLMLATRQLSLVRNLSMGVLWPAKMTGAPPLSTNTSVAQIVKIALQRSHAPALHLDNERLAQHNAVLASQLREARGNLTVMGGSQADMADILASMQGRLSSMAAFHKNQTTALSSKFRSQLKTALVKTVRLEREKCEVQTNLTISHMQEEFSRTVEQQVEQLQWAHESNPHFKEDSADIAAANSRDAAESNDTPILAMQF